MLLCIQLARNHLLRTTIEAPISLMQFALDKHHHSKCRRHAVCKHQLARDLKTPSLEEQDQPSCIKPFVSESAHLVCRYKVYLSLPVVLLLLNLSVCIHFGYDVIFRCTQAKLLSPPEENQHGARSSLVTAFDGGW